MTDADPPIRRATLAVDALFAAHPPRWVHRNKKALYQHLCPPGTRHIGELTISRWPVQPLPLTARCASAATQIQLRPDLFTYDAAPSGTIEWHLNFAHSSLFIAYGGPLFAQDEMQVAEHPVLACVREHMATHHPTLSPAVAPQVEIHRLEPRQQATDRALLDPATGTDPSPQHGIEPNISNPQKNPRR